MKDAVRIFFESPQRRLTLKIVWLFGLFLSVGFVWYVIYQETDHGIMTVAFLNIGQGDAIYIESPDHRKFIVDGGPGPQIIPELRKVMPFYDRSVDAILNTNPDTDHYVGFMDLINRGYSIGELFEPGTITPTPTHKQFEALIAEKKISRIFAKRGMVIHLGAGADITILFPDQDVSKWTSNDGSIVARLDYGKTSVMLTGDATNKTEEYVLSLDHSADKHQMKSTILKEGHHGSRTSADLPFTQAVAPEYDVISAGFHNRYGFPHKETVALMNKLHIPMLITFKLGTIVAASNGQRFTISYK